MAPNHLDKLRIKLFANGADLGAISRLYADLRIKGLTTNPTLMRKAGIADYAREALQVVKSKPISFEVFTDDFKEMHRQALKIAAWQDNVYVKIPITNKLGDSAAGLIKSLSKAGLWASVREILNIFHADQCGCHIVTVPHEILTKAISFWGMNLDELSRQTVKMFADDAASAGYQL